MPVILAVSLWSAVAPSHAEILPLATPPASAELLIHHLVVQVEPQEHRLIADDTTSVRVRAPFIETLTFTLNAALSVRSITDGESDSNLEFHVRSTGSEPEAVQLVTVRLRRSVKAGEMLSLIWRYDGVINEPPREPRHLRFVTPSETAGHVGPEGVYLSGETHWYPDLPRSLSRFGVTVTLPKAWSAVTHGRLVSKGTEDSGASTERWEVAVRTEALTLVANRFVSATQRWGEIDVQTHLFAEDAHLAREYLDAAVQYLSVFEKLLGPYPFPKFAVVENFFASGLGMPSFTLLGNSVIKRRYTQPYALGHEIVHSWIGNWVLNDPDGGNWVEGMTTYLANYYFDEFKGRVDEARQQRRMMLFGYALYVTAETDYPVVEFQRKSDQKDNAIGYQKAAMVIHMLRREMGEEPFWSGLKHLVTERREQYTSWADLEQIFSQAAGRPLRWFFNQWIERPGAPTLALSEVRDEPLDGVHRVTGQLVQSGVHYRLQVPVMVELGSENVRKIDVHAQSEDRPFMVTVDGSPRRVRLDPDYEVLRRLDRSVLPPMLNLFVTDPNRTVVLPDASEPEAGPYEDLVKRLLAQDDHRGKPVAVMRGTSPPGKGSVLVLGGPRINSSALWAGRMCGDEVRVTPDGFSIGRQDYHGPDVALLLSCRHPNDEDSVVTLFYGTTAPAAAKVARLLFFYGWQSFLVFRDGAVIARGEFAERNDGQVVEIHAP